MLLANVLRREFLLDRKITFLKFHDADMNVARDVLGRRAYPTTFLGSADGIVRCVVECVAVWDAASWQHVI